MDESLRQLLEAARDFGGRTNGSPSRDEFVEWAYGQAALENPAVTREIARRAVDELLETTAA